MVIYKYLEIYFFEIVIFYIILAYGQASQRQNIKMDKISSKNISLNFPNLFKISMNHVKSATFS